MTDILIQRHRRAPRLIDEGAHNVFIGVDVHSGAARDDIHHGGAVGIGAGDAGDMPSFPGDFQYVVDPRRHRVESLGAAGSRQGEIAERTRERPRGVAYTVDLLDDRESPGVGDIVEDAHYSFARIEIDGGATRGQIDRCAIVRIGAGQPGQAPTSDSSFGDRIRTRRHAHEVLLPARRRQSEGAKPIAGEGPVSASAAYHLFYDANSAAADVGVGADDVVADIDIDFAGDAWHPGGAAVHLRTAQAAQIVVQVGLRSAAFANGVHAGCHRLLAGGAAIADIRGIDDAVDGQVEVAAVIGGQHLGAHLKLAACRDFSIVADPDDFMTGRAGNNVGWPGGRVGDANAGAGRSGWIRLHQRQGELPTRHRVDPGGRLPLHPASSRHRVIDELPARRGRSGINLRLADARRQAQRPGAQVLAAHELIDGISPTPLIWAFFSQFDAVDVIHGWVKLGIQWPFRDAKRFARRAVAGIGVDPTGLRFFAKLKVASGIWRQDGVAIRVGDLTEADVGALRIPGAQRPTVQTRFTGVMAPVAVLIVIFDGVIAGGVGRQHVDAGAVRRYVLIAVEYGGDGCHVVEVFHDVVGGADVALAGACLERLDGAFAIWRQRVCNHSLVEAHIAGVRHRDGELGVVGDEDLLQIRGFLNGNRRLWHSEFGKDARIVAHQLAGDEIIDEVGVILAAIHCAGDETEDV